MSFNLPTLEETRAQVGSDIEAHLPIKSAKTRRNAAGVLAFAQAGAVQGLYAHIDYRYRNFLPDEMADAEGVERWARVYTMWYRDPTNATGVINISGAIGATLRAGSQLQYSQGLIYTVRESVTLVSTSGAVTVDAQVSGTEGNLAAGSRVTLLSPVTGIQSAAVVAEGGITGGTDLETLDSLRVRVKRRMSQPVQGGSLNDYEVWALESHPAITRAWATEHEQGIGSVIVRIVCDNQESPIPSAEVLDVCTAYIAHVRPAGRRSVYVLPPVAEPVNYQIRVEPNTDLVKAAVESELRDLHRRESRPGGTLKISHIREAVSLAVGETDNSVEFPTENVVAELGHILVFGGIEWM